MANYLFSFVLMLFLVACSTVAENDGRIPTLGMMTEVSAPTATAVASQPTSENELIPYASTATLVSEEEGLTGSLVTFGPQGLQKIDVSGGHTQYLLTPEDDWLDWGAEFAQNSKQVAYWIKRDSHTELWIASLPQWQPKLILEVDDAKYDFATPAWGSGNDRYLFFQLSITKTYYSLEYLKTIRTYIFDMKIMEFVGEPYWPGDCSLLARSPQTEQIALWCYQEDDPTAFLVLEPDKSAWYTETPPDVLAKDCITYAYCAWSQDGQVVAAIGAGPNQEPPPHLLHIRPAPNSEVRTLTDNSSSDYSFERWSPDNSLLYYSGACGNGSIQCPNVMSVAEGDVLWQAWDNSNHGVFSNINVGNVIWSPDSRHLAMVTYQDEGLEIIVFDITIQQEAVRLTTDVILDLVWVAE